MNDRKTLAGKFVWFELASTDAKRAVAFYAEVVGWQVRPFATLGAAETTYDMIYAAGTMIGGVSPRFVGPSSHFIAYLSVDDVDATVAAAVRNGGKIVTAPHDISGVGRAARIADPQGAELCPFHSASGDPPDADAPLGGWVWNELHTSPVSPAIAFYEDAFGFSGRTLGADAASGYTLLSRGGVDRAGVSGHLAPGVSPHWLPYVLVENVDATAERARRLGGTLRVTPADIPGIGRFAIFSDPTGATLAVLKPLPRQTSAA